MVNDKRVCRQSGLVAPAATETMALQNDAGITLFASSESLDGQEAVALADSLIFRRWF